MMVTSKDLVRSSSTAINIDKFIKKTTNNKDFYHIMPYKLCAFVILKGNMKNVRCDKFLKLLKKSTIKKMCTTGSMQITQRLWLKFNTVSSGVPILVDNKSLSAGLVGIIAIVLIYQYLDN